MSRAATILAPILALAPSVWALEQARNEPTTIGVTAAEVSVDFVARDKKGRLVRDLRPEEVEVYEDGVRQEVELFRLVTTAPAEPPVPGLDDSPPSTAEARPEPPAVPPPSPEVEEDAVVALVFDRLGHESRRNAFEAAEEWVKLPAVAGRRVGVFRIDQGLEVLQDFTDDRATVRDALEDVLMSVPTAYSAARDRERMRSLRQELAVLDGRSLTQATTGSLSAEFAGGAMLPPQADRGQSSMAREMQARELTLQLAMLQATEALERDQQGLATTNALLALVNGLRTLPGRKAVVFFSEGLVLPERVLATMTTVVSEANRGGVSFYAADAAGLRVRSGAEEQRRELAGVVDLLGTARNDDVGAGSRAPMTRMMERNEDLLRFDPASGLGTLARDTGGFLIQDTNDIASGLRLVEEELGSYYLLSYAPANETWDGRYRRIEVKVRRRGVTVQARQGYFAVLTRTPTPVLEHEAPALASLERSPNAREIPLRVGALHFPDGFGESVVAVFADIPGGAPALLPDEEHEVLRQDFTVLALVRDESGRVVHKASRHYALSWPAASLEDVRRGRVLFERQAVLGPGRYTVEVVARDARGEKAGVGRTALEVPAVQEDRLRVSSLMVVGHAEPRATGEPGPLLYQGMQLYPNLGDPHRAGGGQPLAFLFSVRPGGRPLAEATVELLRDGTSVLESPVALPVPDASGQV